MVAESDPLATAFYFWSRSQNWIKVGAEARIENWHKVGAEARIENWRKVGAGARIGVRSEPESEFA